VRTSHVLLAAVLGLFVISSGFPDTLTLRNGKVIDGNFVGGTTRQVKMETSAGTQVFDIGEVASIVFTPSGAPAVAAPAAAVPAPAASQPVAAAGQNIEIPAGTHFVVRMIDSVDSERNQVGQTFHASMDEPVYLHGNQIVPRGSDVVVRLVDSKESGKIAGRSSLTLNLASVSINGRMVDINTSSVSQVSSSRGARTAKTTGGGAALGAAIGGIAGGGRGAAIGAGAGAGAGVAVQVLTNGQRVRVPSETRLSFRLESTVKI